MGKVKKSYKSFDELSVLLPKEDKTREKTQYPGYKEHEKYSEWVYNSENVFSEKAPEFDFRYTPWEKIDKILASWANENLSTSKSFSDRLQKSKSDIFDTLDIIPKHSNNKIISMTEKINKMLKNWLRELNNKDVENFIKSVDLWKQMMENKVYMGMVSNANKKWLTVCIWSQFWHPIEYDIDYNELSDSMKTKKFHKWLEVFVDIKKDEIKHETKANLVSRNSFDKPRFEQLKSMNIQINWYKPIFYMTKSWKIFKWNVVWLGDDVFGKQVIFKTKDGKNQFPITIDSLKKWMELARSSYAKIEKNRKKPIVLRKKTNSKSVAVKKL